MRAGKQGIGVKRGASPSAAERIAKMAKMATETDHRDYRERARDEYKNRQAQGRLGALSTRFLLAFRS